MSFMCVDAGFVASFHHFYSIFAVETAVWPYVDILLSISLLLIAFYSVCWRHHNITIVFLIYVAIKLIFPSVDHLFYS